MHPERQAEVRGCRKSQPLKQLSSAPVYTMQGCERQFMCQGVSTVRIAMRLAGVKAQSKAVCGSACGGEVHRANGLLACVFKW